MRVVFDTGVLFAALISRNGLCATVVEQALQDDDVFLSGFILDELRSSRTRKTALSSSTIDGFVALLGEAAELVVPASVAPDVCRDVDDAVVLGTAMSAKADVLVTGDKDLLVLGRFSGVAIVTPRELHDRLSGGR
jgi:putative PIN family toxin of toxin-antitoxin system